MAKRLESMLVACLASLAAPAFGGDEPARAFDPTDFLKEQEFKAAERRAAEAIESANVVIAGREYLRLTSIDGTIYVPAHETLETSDLDLALCDSAFRPTELSLAIKSAAQRRIVQAVSHSAAFVLDAIRDKCRKKI